ncbi:Site-specific recombinase XerD [Ferrimonas sediminum]|uniref:Site-specific recombinase XerD n=2 Tax=Ferrimonas sediminum TaxID=718193 RepID=A0A1G8VX10_9GAMM|nr:Site-specific recombinase XerD [Ferrimonas sediminum]
MNPHAPAMPLFDTLKHFDHPNEYINKYIALQIESGVSDAGLTYELAYDWLLEQKAVENNFKSHRSELTTFFHWLWQVEQCSILQVDRRSLARYLEFCQQPPTGLIGFCNVPQFQLKDGERRPNPKWRPFLGKKDLGQELAYQLSHSAIRTKLALLSAFFSYLIDVDFGDRNPAAILLRAGRYKNNQQHLTAREDDENLKAFSELQWSYVMACVDRLAEQQPDEHQRSRFLISLMYSCYLRISEVAARPGFSPVMGQFRRDKKTGVWGFFVPLSKSGKSGTVAVSDALLAALKQYRGHLGLSELPAPDEQTPLFVRHKASAHGRDAGVRHANLGIRQIREVIDGIIASAANEAEADGLSQDAAEMRTMTTHSLRHTGISHDINIHQRPLSHVQADARHDSIDTTSRYLHTSRVERHQSAARKPMDGLANQG